MAVYLDNAATTEVRSEALDAMLPLMRGDYANPSSAHSAGQRARRALDAARARTAAALGAHPDEIVFTGSGSEADCMAIFGLSAPGASQRRHLITSAIEHHAVLHAADTLRARGHAVTIVPVDAQGFVHADALAEALRARADSAEDATMLVSIMHANNEIGTIEPIARLAAIAHEHGALFHTDAVQTAGHIPIDVAQLGIDALSLSAHKFEGPKGVGALYVRKGACVEPLIVGGAQEGGRRAGTENVAGIVGLSVALDLAVHEIASQSVHIAALRDALIDGALALPGASLNGAREERLPNNASLRFEGVDGQTAVLALDVAGFEASTGSACASGSLEPSHVLSALGLPPGQARGTVRFSLGRTTSADDIARLLSRLPGTIEKLRALADALNPGGGLARARE
ncbi:MAG: aminotransferase class V-fold PLP-dependent enzyme [Candidatus Eremiobacteraeota bacterium]|nr:aminotransferase class V-fold PLP-dependent enzyme [Candidatus Eremiobacteraeota bacterium]